MDVLTRDEWGAQPPNRDYVDIGWADRPGLETHHSVGIYRADTAAGFAWEVQDDHLSRGWTDVFYNWLIWLDGQIVEARPDHAKSGPIEHLTVCFAGNYDHRRLTDRQKVSWHQVRDHLTAHGGGTAVAWHGQRAQVGCPGDDVIGWLQAGHPEPQEDDMNALPLVKLPDSNDDDRVWVVYPGLGRAHVEGWQWRLLPDPRDSSPATVRRLPADHQVWDMPVLDGLPGGGPHDHDFKVTVSGTTSEP